MKNLLLKIVIGIMNLILHLFVWYCVLITLSGDAELSIIFGCISAGLATGVMWGDIND